MDRSLELVRQDKYYVYRSRHVDGSKVSGHNWETTTVQPVWDSRIIANIIENECQKEIKDICKIIQYHLGKAVG